MITEDEKFLAQIQTLLAEMRIAKEKSSGAKARAYAVTITELEKTYAYFKTYVVYP